MKVFLISLAIKGVLMLGIGAVALVFINKEINRRAHNRVEIAVKWEVYKQERQWHKVPRWDQAKLTTPRDGVDRHEGWQWQRNKQKEYRLVIVK